MRIRIPLFVFKIISVLLLFIPFFMCWLLWYEPHSIAPVSEQASILISLFFIAGCYFTCDKQDTFMVSVLRIRDLIYGMIISSLITDIIMYLTIWMISYGMPRLWPGLLAFPAQCLISVVWAVIMHKLYFLTHPALKTCLVYDEREGVDELIRTYGLEKRFDVRKAYRIESVIDSLNRLNRYEAVFITGVRYEQRNVLLKYCVDRDIRVFMLPRIADVMTRGAKQIHMLHLPMMRLQRASLPPEYSIAKRLIDIVLAIVSLVILSPLMIAVSLIIRSDGGPAFYRQKRLTKDGRVFKMLKFRSMCMDAEKRSGAVLSAGEKDPRITKIGRVLRMYRLDELPQLFNILKGDMSFVGPRPERPEIRDRIVRDLPEFDLRLQVKAGLTGYAQVYGKYNTAFYDKLLMDLMYISKQNLVEDMCIILATIKILFIPESTEGVADQNVTNIGTPKRVKIKSAEKRSPK